LAVDSEHLDMIIFTVRSLFTVWV